MQPGTLLACTMQAYTYDWVFVVMLVVCCSDAYVKVLVGGCAPLSTTVVTGTINPTWNSTFQFPAPNRKVNFKISVKHKRAIRNAFLGGFNGSVADFRGAGEEKVRAMLCACIIYGLAFIAASDWCLSCTYSGFH